jgi:hypothetical protein
MDVAEANVALVRMAVGTYEGSETMESLRKVRTDAGLPEFLEPMKELHLAVNNVSREDELEGDEYLNLLEMAQKQENGESTDEEKKLFESEVSLLKEGLALNDDGTVNICLITPGWGNSGWYSESLLKNNVEVFGEGLHMYWDHPTVSDDYQRPERSLRDLAGVLAENAAWQDQGFNGPGVYASAKVFSPYMENLDDMAPYIGCSVIVYATSHVGEVDGTSGDIIDSFLAARCVDFVTLPARGGKVQAKFESLKEGRRIKQLIESGKGGELVDEATAKQIKDENEALKTENESLKTESKGYRDVALKSAHDKVVEAALADVKNLPEEARNKIQNQLSATPIIKDNKIDEDVVKEAVKNAVKEEAEYLAKLGVDKVTDLGPTTRSNGESNGDTEMSDDEFKESIQSTFEDLGLSKESAEIAARGRK